MANDKETRLSIVIRTVDQATARIKAINERLDKATKPARDFKKALAELKEKSGLDSVITGVRGVGSAFADLLGKVALVGGVVGAAVVGLKSMIDEFDDLGDKAERLGVGVDFLAQMRYAAKRSGAEVQNLDKGFENLSKSIGEMRAGGGKMAKFLGTVSPALLKQLKATKGNEEAFNLLADAMAKIQDPAKRAAFAQKTLGDASLAPLLAKGSRGLKELRDRYAELAGSQEGAVGAAGEFGDSMDDLKAATDGIKAALVTGLAPALKVIVDRLREWFVANRERIAEWAKNIGDKLPAAIQRVIEWIGKAWDKVTAFVDAVGGLKNVAIGAAAIMAGPLIGSVVSLGSALVTTISRVAQLRAGLAAASAAGGGGGLAGALGALGPIGLAIGGAYLASELTGGPIGKGQGGAMGLAEQMAKHQERVKALQGQGRTELTDTVFRAMDNARSADAQQAKVTVDFANAPRGTRASVDPQSSADVDLSVGYNMLPGGAL